MLALARDLFARPEAEQLDVGMERATREPAPGEPAYWRLHGPNQWPESLPALRDVVLGWLRSHPDVARRHWADMVPADH